MTTFPDFIEGVAIVPSPFQDPAIHLVAGGDAKFMLGAIRDDLISSRRQVVPEAYLAALCHKYLIEPQAVLAELRRAGTPEGPALEETDQRGMVRLADYWYDPPATSTPRVQRWREQQRKAKSRALADPEGAVDGAIVELRHASEPSPALHETVTRNAPVSGNGYTVSPPIRDKSSNTTPTEPNGSLGVLKTPDVTSNPDVTSGDLTQVSTETSSKRSKPRRADVEGICDAMVVSLLRRGAKEPSKALREGTWRTEARLMLDADHRPLEQVLSVIQWLTTDDFWSTNILGIRKLRKQFDQLRLRMERDRSRAQPSAPSRDRGAVPPSNARPAGTYDVWVESKQVLGNASSGGNS